MTFIKEVILKPTGLVGMVSCGVGLTYTTIEPVITSIASQKHLSDDYLLNPTLFAAGAIFSYLLYKG